MTKIFNLHQNSILQQLVENFDSTNTEIEEYEDSLHLFLPIKLSSFLDRNEKVLMNLLRKTKVSINALIITNDQKLLEVKKTISHSHNHILNNTPILSSFKDFINKIDSLSKTLYPKERQLLNNQLRSINTWNYINQPTPKKKISFMELMNLCGLNFSAPISNEGMLMLPGGKVASQDTTLIHTVRREIYEEVNLRIDANYQSKKLIYHNIFDKLSEQFYHNLIVLIPVGINSNTIIEQFERNFEIESLLFRPITDERYKAIFNILYRE